MKNIPAHVPSEKPSKATVIGKGLHRWAKRNPNKLMAAGAAATAAAGAGAAGAGWGLKKLLGGKKKEEEKTT